MFTNNSLSLINSHSLSHLSLKKRASIFILYTCLFIAFFNYVLRTDPDSSLSLYRIVMPLQMVALALLSKKTFLNWLSISGFILIFGCFGMLISGYSLTVEYNVIFLLHYLTIALTYFTVKVLDKYQSRNEMHHFIQTLFYLAILLGFLELYLGIRLPNVMEKSGVVRALMRNENDLSLMLGAASIYFFYFGKNIFLKLLPVFLTLFFTFINDAKVVILTVILVFTVWVYDVIINNKHIGNKVRIVLRIVVFTICFILIFSFIELLGNMRLGSYNMIELLLEPITRVLTLEPYGLGAGSLTVRTDMTIFAIKDIINSYGFGIGFGNSLAMIETSRYGVILEGASSIHNFPLQILLELGIGIVIPLLYLFFRHVHFNGVKLIVILFLMSLSQSVGAFSNYYFLVILAYIIIKYNKKNCVAGHPK